MSATAEQTLADERERRVPAAVAAAAAGVLALIGSQLLPLVAADAPAVPLLESLRMRLSDAPAPEPGLLARKLLYLSDHSAELVVAQIVPAIALAVTAFALTYLYRATKARQPAINKIAIVLVVAGGVLVLVPTIVGVISGAIDVAAFAAGSDRSERAARAVLTSPTRDAAAYLAPLGGFVLGIGIVFNALFAMRVGLLTRFLGVLGMIVGVLVALQLEGELPLVRTFWMLALAALLLGRWPAGMPPAWETGEAQAWPTQQEIREARLASQAERTGKGLGGGGGGGGKAPRAKSSPDLSKPPRGEERRSRRQRAEPPDTPAPELPPRRPHPSSKKRKRKRR